MEPIYQPRQAQTYDGALLKVTGNSKEHLSRNDSVADTNLSLYSLTDSAPEKQFSYGVQHLKQFGWDAADDVYPLFNSAAEQDHLLASCYKTLVDMKRCASHFGEGSELGPWITFDDYEVARCVSPDRRNHTTYADIRQCAANIRTLSTQCLQAAYVAAWVFINKCDRQDWRAFALPRFAHDMQFCADRGYAPAQYQHAGILYDGGETEKALHRLEQAAQQDYAPAQYLLEHDWGRLSAPQSEPYSYRKIASHQGRADMMRAIATQLNETAEFDPVRKKLFIRDNPAFRLTNLSQEITQHAYPNSTIKLLEMPAMSFTWLDEMLESMRWDSNLSVLPRQLPPPQDRPMFFSGCQLF